MITLKTETYINSQQKESNFTYHKAFLTAQSGGEVCGEWFCAKVLVGFNKDCWSPEDRKKYQQKRKMDH